jgi:hypothetical protein
MYFSRVCSYSWRVAFALCCVIVCAKVQLSNLVLPPSLYVSICSIQFFYQNVSICADSWDPPFLGFLCLPPSSIEKTGREKTPQTLSSSPAAHGSLPELSDPCSTSPKSTSRHHLSTLRRPILSLLPPPWTRTVTESVGVGELSVTGVRSTSGGGCGAKPWRGEIELWRDGGEVTRRQCVVLLRRWRGSLRRTLDLVRRHRLDFLTRCRWENQRRRRETWWPRSRQARMLRRRRQQDGGGRSRGVRGYCNKGGRLGRVCWKRCGGVGGPCRGFGGHGGTGTCTCSTGCCGVDGRHGSGVRRPCGGCAVAGSSGGILRRAC